MADGDEITRREGMRKYPWIVASDGLHDYRRHDSRLWRFGNVLSSGGLSLIDNRRGRPCSCNRDATAMINALLDAGFVIVPEHQENDGRDQA